MPEYRRFISYFYEYTDGKKRRNAGFAKVELRNGMWRILFRINAESLPGSQAQVYGFVREPDCLRGILLGEIRPVQQIAEEWAFRADVSIGRGDYRVGDLAGIWIESGGGRQFITCWDDEEIDAESFAMEVSRELEPELSGNAGESDSTKSETAGDFAEPEASGDSIEPEASVDPAELEASSDSVELEVSSDSTELEASGDFVEVEVSGDSTESETSVDPAEPEASDDSAGLEVSGEFAEQEISGNFAAGEMAGPEEAKKAESETSQICAVIEEMFRKRAAFQPFDDAEIESCVMILPCDIVRLQQENWNVGRSSFLQHGFYQYRHLLLGKNKEGSYILGVPGIRNPQETYMAQMFGYDLFRKSARPDTGQTFGYWCRELRQT